MQRVAIKLRLLLKVLLSLLLKVLNTFLKVFLIVLQVPRPMRIMPLMAIPVSFAYGIIVKHIYHTLLGANPRNQAATDP